MKRPPEPAEHGHPVPEPDRLPHVVGHEEHGQPALAADPVQLLVQQVAGHRVERTERLVHEQHVGVLRERAGERYPLAHAAGELVWPLAAEPAEVHGLEEFRSPLTALGFGHALGAQRELDVARGGEPGKQASFLEHHRDLPPTSPAPFIARGHLTGGGRPSATSDSSVLLPHPEAPMRQTNSPGATSSDTRSRAGVADGPRP